MAAKPTRTRRDEYTEQTKAAVLAAARQLFARQGYILTKVDEIAELARVSPATVYAQCGGKQGLLRSLMDQWTKARLVAATNTAVRGSEDPVEIMRILAAAYRSMHEDWHDVTKVVLETAPHDLGAASVLAIAQRRHRAAQVVICRRLTELDALRPELDLDTVGRLINYYFGLDGLHRLRAYLRGDGRGLFAIPDRAGSGEPRHGRNGDGRVVSLRRCRPRKRERKDAHARGLCLSAAEHGIQHSRRCARYRAARLSQAL